MICRTMSQQDFITPHIIKCNFKHWNNLWLDNL